MIPISLSSPHGAAKRICFTDLFLLSLIFHARQQFSLVLIVSQKMSVYGRFSQTDAVDAPGLAFNPIYTLRYDY